MTQFTTIALEKHGTIYNISPSKTKHNSQYVCCELKFILHLCEESNMAAFINLDQC